MVDSSWNTALAFTSKPIEVPWPPAMATSMGVEMPSAQAYPMMSVKSTMIAAVAEDGQQPRREGKTGQCKRLASRSRWRMVWTRKRSGRRICRRRWPVRRKRKLQGKQPDEVEKITYKGILVVYETEYHENGEEYEIYVYPDGKLAAKHSHEEKEEQ